MTIRHVCAFCSTNNAMQMGSTATKNGRTGVVKWWNLLHCIKCRRSYRIGRT